MQNISSNRRLTKRTKKLNLNYDVLRHTPSSKPRTTRDQPSAITNTSNFNGKDTIVGGNMTRPVETTRVATTQSNTRKGSKIRKPIINATSSSLTRKAGKSTSVGIWS
jgi:hypothetical protein